MAAVVQFENVTKLYASPWRPRRVLRALDSVSLSIEPGEIFGLVGPNRAGKTTLVKILLSICRPTSGRVMRLGAPWWHRETLARVGYVHESQAFPRYLTARTLLEYYAALTLVPAALVRQRAPELLERFGLADRSREPIGRFSKGMLQRLALAQALINDPDLLVLDEPSEGMDLSARRLLGEVLTDRRNRGQTAILVSHALSDIERLCDRVAVLRGGRAAFVGPVSALTAHAPAGRRPRSKRLSNRTMRRHWHDARQYGKNARLADPRYFPTIPGQRRFLDPVGDQLRGRGCLRSATVEGGTPLAYPGENPDFLPRDDRDAQDTAKLKSSGVVAVSGDLKLAFGAIRIPLARDARGAVHFLELLLAGGVADTLGLLLTLIWTAGFLPGFLEGRSVAVLLAKPVPRWSLLVGKYIGVLCFVLASASIFVVGTWSAIGLRTGIWDAGYLYAIPLLVLHFAMFFSVSALLAVWTQSTVICVFGSIVFWGVAWSINYGRHALTVAADTLSTGSFSPGLTWLADAGYWLLPKPADVNLLLFNLLEADGSFARLFKLDTLQAHGFSFAWSIVTSLIFTVAVLAFSARKLDATDY